MTKKESLLYYPPKHDLKIELVGGAISCNGDLYDKFYIRLTNQYAIIKNYKEIVRKYFE